MPDIDDILNCPVEDLPVDLQIPTGQYQFSIRAATDRDETLRTTLTLTAIEALDCDDPDEFETWKDEKGDDAVVFLTYRGSKRSRASQLRNFAQTTGLDHTKNLIGHEFVASVTYDANPKDPKRPWQRLRDFKRLEGDSEAA